jgi:hypothetical protein
LTGRKCADVAWQTENTQIDSQTGRHDRQTYTDKEGVVEGIDGQGDRGIGVVEGRMIMFLSSH